MKRRLALAAAGLLLGAAPAAAGAQQRPALTLAPGTEIRLATAGAPGVRLLGRVERSTRDSLFVSLLGARAPRGYAVAELASLEARGGRDRGRGARIGAGIGAGIALVFGGIDAARGEVGGGEVAGAAVGNALLGGLVGSLLAPRGWQRLPLAAPPPPPGV